MSKFDDLELYTHYNCHAIVTEIEEEDILFVIKNMWCHNVAYSVIYSDTYIGSIQRENTFGVCDENGLIYTVNIFFADLFGLKRPLDVTIDVMLNLPREESFYH